MKVSKPIENIVLYLNTETNCVKTAVAGKNTEFTWQISPIVLSEYSIIKLCSLAHTNTANHGDNIMTFRLKDIIYNPELYRSTDNCGYPIIWSMPFITESAFFDCNLGGLYLTPQTINRISIIVSDDVVDANAGLNSDIKLVIGLCIQEYDRRYSDVEN